MRITYFGAKCPRETKMIKNAAARVWYDPGFNTGEAENLVKSFTDPLTTFLLWAVPIICVIACIARYVSWAAKDDDEQQQKPIWKSIKNYIFWAVIVESVSAIMKILGL